MFQLNLHDLIAPNALRLERLYK